MTIPEPPLSRQASAYALGSQYGRAYLETLSDRSVLAEKSDLDMLDLALPDQGVSAETILELMHRVGSPGTMASAAGRYFGYVIGGSLPAASGARALLSAWDQTANSDTGPSVIKLEEIAIRWAIDLLDLPTESTGAFTTGATMANMTLLMTARDRQLDRLGHPRGKGLIGAPALRVIASAEIHATVLKSLRMIGLGSDAIEFVPVDDQGRMRADQMPDLDPSCLVLAQAGNVCTGSYDPFDALADQCQAAGAWLHVDGAFGLWARASSQLAPALAGLERADSWVVDAHKTLNAPYDSGLALCRHPDELRASMAIGAGYLPKTDPTPSDLAPEFSRAARGAETWAALLSLGRQGLDEMVTRFHHQAVSLVPRLEALGFDVPHQVHFNQVFVTRPGEDALCANVVKHVQRSGEAWFGAATWQGQNGFRISLSNWATQDQDLDRLMGALETALGDLA